MYLSGYRMSEVPIIPIPTPKKMRIRFHQQTEPKDFRPVLAVSLPLCLEGATPPRPDPSDTDSCEAAIYKRAGFCPPKPKAKIRRQFRRFVQLWLRRHVKPLDAIPTVPEWLETTDYDLGRKNELLRVWDDCQGFNDAKHWGRVKSFWKDETYETYKYPRAINSRVDAAKCFFGPIVHAVSEVIFSLKWFIKKIPVCDRPKVISEMSLDGAVYRATDATSFEAHFDAQLMEDCENQLFTHMCKGLPCWRELDYFLHKVKAGQNVCKFKLFTVLIGATRMSGEMDTSLSNGFANLMMYLFLSWRNGLDPDRDIMGYVEGDDGLFRSNKSYLDPTTQDYLDLGILIKIDSTRNLSEASFCGQVYDQEELVVVTDPKEVIARFGFTNKKYVNANKKTLMQLLRSKGFSLVHQYHKVPLLSVLGHRILQLTDGYIIEERILKNFDQWERQKIREAMTSKRTYAEPGIRTRQLVEKLYGIDVPTQLRCEAQLAKLDLGFFKLDLDFPSSWTDYWDRYSLPIKENYPAWLVRQSPEFKRLLVERRSQAGVTKNTY